MEASEPAVGEGPTASQVIDRLGGTVKTAALCEVTPQAVTQWRRAGIPLAWEKFLRATQPQAFLGGTDGAPTPQAQEVRDAA